MSDKKHSQQTQLTEAEKQKKQQEAKQLAEMQARAGEQLE